MTKEQFDLKYRGDKVAVHCDTEEKAKALLSLAKSFGFKWSSGNDLEKISYWENYKENTCYRFYDTVVETFSKKHYIKYNYKIVEFTLDEPKETFNIGDVVYDNLSGRKCTIIELKYLVNFDEGGISFKKISELTKSKPLTKITKEQLTKMGYEVEEK